MPPGIIEDLIKPEASPVLDQEGNYSVYQLYCLGIYLIWNFIVFQDANHLESGIGEEDYQALTEREERDLENLLSQSNSALSNAEKFMDQLAKDLSLLDGV